VTSWFFNYLTPLFNTYVKDADGLTDAEAITMIELISAVAYGLLFLPLNGGCRECCEPLF
jgi:hypothetical protein